MPSATRWPAKSRRGRRWAAATGRATLPPEYEEKRDRAARAAEQRIDAYDSKEENQVLEREPEPATRRTATASSAAAVAFGAGHHANKDTATGSVGMNAGWWNNNTGTTRLIGKAQIGGVC